MIKYLEILIFNNRKISGFQEWRDKNIIQIHGISLNPWDSYTSVAVLVTEDFSEWLSEITTMQ